jgi:hypothetical protein
MTKINKYFFFLPIILLTYLFNSISTNAENIQWVPPKGYTVLKDQNQRDLYKKNSTTIIEIYTSNESDKPFDSSVAVAKTMPRIADVEFTKSMFEKFKVEFKQQLPELQTQNNRIADNKEVKANWTNNIYHERESEICYLQSFNNNSIREQITCFVLLKKRVFKLEIMSMKQENASSLKMRTLNWIASLRS